MRRPWIVLAALTAACGSTGTTAEPTETPLPTPPPTVPGVGSLPDTIPAVRPVSNGEVRVNEPLVVITRPVTPDGVLADPIGEQVGGNRLLMIGDSIFAGTENRYGGEMCAGLEQLGWTVEVAAEAGRFVEFGVKVAKRLIPEPPDPDSDPTDRPDGDWDAVAVFLGSNYNGNQENFDTKMRQILDRIAPRPTLLYTVTQYRTNYVEVSEVIDRLVDDYENVTLIDWAAAAKTPGVLRADGLHPNNEGEQVLVDLTGAALGRAPSADEVTCIRSQFRDDSAITQGNGSPNTGGSSSGSGSSSSSGSSSGGGSSSSSSGSSSSSSSSGGSSSTGGSTTTTEPGSTDGTTDSTSGGGDSDSTGGDTDSTDGGTDSTDGGGTDSTDGGTDSTDGGGTDSTDGGSGSTDDGGTDSTDGGGTDSTDGGDSSTTDGSATSGTTSGSSDTATGGGSDTTSGTTSGSSDSSTSGSSSGSSSGSGSSDSSSTTGGGDSGTGSTSGTTTGAATTDGGTTTDGGDAGP